MIFKATLSIATRCTPFKKRPLTDNPTDIYTNADLAKMTNSNTINSDIIIRGENIVRFANIKKINGNLGINDSSIQNLGRLKKVKGSLYIAAYTICSNIRSLNQLESVGGDLNLRYSNIENLGALKKVGGQISLRDTKIKDLGNLAFVGGNLFLPKRLQNKIDLTNITVKGKIRFWNDIKNVRKIKSKSEMGYYEYKNTIPYWRNKYIYSLSELRDVNTEQLNFYKIYKDCFMRDEYIDVKGNDNYSFILFYDLLENYSSNIDELQYHLAKLAKYYPKTEPYGEAEILKCLEKNKDFEAAWKNISQKHHITVQTIIEYEDKLNRELLNGELIVQIAGFSHLTEFGQKNIDKIKPVTDKQLRKYKQDNDCKFFELFIQNNKPIRSGTNCVYDSKYYKNFFLSNTEYLHYKAIDDFQLKAGNTNPFPYVVEKSILNQCRLILKQAEDVYRESIGMPKVGEGWISETELYYKLSEHFTSDEVVQHASPKWLGRQHLDIYFPQLNIGVEYQGAQHNEPIEFFGGQIAFEKTVERDNRKKKLCREHKCYLICVEKDYNIMQIITEIENKRCTTLPIENVAVKALTKS